MKTKIMTLKRIKNQIGNKNFNKKLSYLINILMYFIIKKYLL
jgi:hypothetical protein